MNQQDLLERVRTLLRPSDDIAKLAQTVQRKISLRVIELGIRAEVVVGGSVAKNTHLADSGDVDIFVRFLQEHPEEEYSALLEDILIPFKPVHVQGSRKYFQFSYRTVSFEVVPVRYITSSSDARNITDVSPLHVAYVQTHGSHLVDDIRLLKQLCKSCEVYGAESFIRGFSGHVLDILVIHYGSFLSCIQHIAQWTLPVQITPIHDQQNTVKNIKQDKHIPLIVLDPIQPQRNAAAAVSEEKCLLLMEYCSRFLQNPSEEFFTLKEFDVERLCMTHKESNFFMCVRLRCSSLRRDVAGSQVRSLFERIVHIAKREHFILHEASWKFLSVNESYLWFDAQPPAEHVERRGPPVSEKKHVKAFLKEHGDAYVRDAVWYALVPRRFSSLTEIIFSVQDAFSDVDIEFLPKEE